MFEVTIQSKTTFAHLLTFDLAQTALIYLLTLAN